MALFDIISNNLNLDCRTTYGLCKEDIHEIESYDRMPLCCIHNIIEEWSCLRAILKVNIITFQNGKPYGFNKIVFYNLGQEVKEQFIEFMAKISLTHRLMFVESDGGIFVTESEDGQTNIDAELIELLANSAFRE